MKTKKKYYLTARAVPSCLCLRDEREIVERIRVTVTLEATCLGPRIRDKLTVLAWNALRDATAGLRFPGVAHPLGGMLTGRPYSEAELQLTFREVEP